MKRRGFTFIELTVVFCIIAILAAILFPVFARARAKAQQNGCLRNLMNIGVGLRVYAQDNYGHFPAVDNDLSPLLARAVPDPLVLICPGARNPLGAVPAGTIPAPPPASLLDYVYWAGACDDDRPSFAICADDQESRHNQGANYLWVDGHVKWMAMSNAVPGAPGAGSSVDSAALREGGEEQLQRLRELKPGYQPDPSRQPRPGGLGAKKGGDE
jgi:prepilin-type processing-associated H-X9-DG protein/prepilin-type N-terminal cleavage/methylation domain-containing protein